MPSVKRKTNAKSERNNSPQERPSHQYVELRSLFGIEDESEDLPLPQKSEEPQGVKPKRKKRKNDQDLDRDKGKVKRTKDSKLEQNVPKQEIIQEPRGKATQVEGYYSNDDVTILLDALLNRERFERIRGGDEQDIVRNLETNNNVGTMVLAPIAEDSDEAIEQLRLDIERAYRHNVKQILVPINIPNIHWYTIQLQLFQLLHWRSLEATVHDSLGIRKNSIVVERLAAQGITVTKQLEGSLPKIQEGELGAKNVYCGGYTARLIANLAVGHRIIGKEAWGCPNNIDQVLRQEDVTIVSEHNSANAGNFGRGSIALNKMLDSALDMSLLRGFIAKEKEFKLLKELKAIYEFIPVGIKNRIMSLAIPENPAKLYAFVRDVHKSLPILKILFQTDASGEIKKDAQGQLKLDTNLEIEHIHNIMVKLLEKCFELENGGAESQDDEEPIEYKESEDIKKGPYSSGTKMVQPPYKGGDPETANSLFDAGVAYFKSGDNKKALDYYRLALNMRQSLYKGDHAEIATSLHSMGVAYQSLGDYFNTLDYYERSLKMRRSLYEGNHAEIATSLHSLGDAYQKLKDNEKALNYHGSGLRMRQLLYEGNHPETATSLYKIGDTYEKLGDTIKALNYHKLALKMRQSLYKDDHSDVADSLYSMGFAYQSLEDSRKALDYYDAALEMRRSLYKGDHPDVADSLYSMGFTYQSLGNTRESLDYHEPCLKMRQSLYEGDSHKIATSLYNVGAAYNKLGEIRKSLDYLEPALDMMQALYYGNHAEIATSLYSVGDAYYKLGNARKALDHLEPALEMVQSLYKGNHAEIAASLHAVGTAYYKLGDAKKSLDYLKPALKMMQSLYKGERSEIAASLHNLGVAYQKLGDNRKALHYKERSLEMKQRLYQGNNVEVSTSLHSMGVAHQSLGDYVTALDYYKRGLKMRQSLYQGSNPCIVESLKSVSIAYKELGETERSLIYQKRANSMMEALNRQEQEAEFSGQGVLSYSANGYLEYYNHGLDWVLGLRLKGLGFNSNAMLLKSRYFEEGLGSAEELARDVVTIFSDGVVRIVLAPFNLYDKHWLGLVFRSLGGMIEVTYMDSEQIAMLPELKSELENGLAINGYGSSFLEARLTPQRYNNCGYEVIENFIYYLTGTKATQEGAVYVHSLLVENSLLDPIEYGLNIEENNRLIGFLSNSAPPLVRSIDALSLSSSNLIQESLKALVHPHGKHKYDNGASVINKANAAVAIDLLPAIKQFNKFCAKWMQNKLRQINLAIYKTNLGFKGLDFAVDSGRLLLEPNVANLKKVALDSSYLYGMYSGVNGYSALVSGTEVAYQLQQGKYQKAFDVTAGTMSAMALPVILAYANRPYLSFVYGILVAASTAYNAVANTYSFILERYEDDAGLKSTVAYKELMECLSASLLQAVYDFGAQATGYKLQVNAMLLKKEKAVIKAQLQDKAIKGTITEEEAKSLNDKPATITYGAQHYDHCLQDVENETQHYYCYNMEQQTLDKVAIIGHEFKVLESL